jgi:hypothetical protein
MTEITRLILGVGVFNKANPWQRSPGCKQTISLVTYSLRTRHTYNYLRPIFINRLQSSIHLIPPPCPLRIPPPRPPGPATVSPLYLHHPLAPDLYIHTVSTKDTAYGIAIPGNLCTVQDCRCPRFVGDGQECNRANCHHTQAVHTSGFRKISHT